MNIKNITIIICILLSLAVLSCKEKPNTVKIHLKIEELGSRRMKCTDMRTYIIELQEGDSFENDLFILSKISLDSTLHLKLKRYLQEFGKPHKQISDTNILILTFDDIHLYEQSPHGYTHYYLKIDSTNKFYDLNSSDEYPIITDVTEADNLCGEIVQKESIEDCSFIKTRWTEIYNVHGLLVKHGVLKKWNNDGDLIHIMSYDSGRAKGATQSWFDHGQQSIDGFFLNNQRDRAWTTWYENGNLKSKELYENGNKFGEYISWHENGAISEQGNYVYYNAKDGPWTRWYPNGNLKSQGYFDHGYTDDTWNYWYANGQLESEGEFGAGLKQGVWTFYYENGKVKELGQMLNNAKHSIWSFWYANGKIREIGLFNKDLKQSDWQYYKENGKQFAFGYYENGSGKTWYIDESPMKEETYTNGRKSGIWREWYENGQIKFEKEYSTGYRKGSETEWYANGQMKLEIKYPNGTNKAMKKEWYENGQIKFEDKNDIGAINDTIKKYHPNGNIQTVYLKYNPNKPINTWYENGNLRSMRIFREGSKDSLAAEWYLNGQKKNERSYSSADSLYLIQAWFTNGQLQVQGKEKYFSRFDRFRCVDDSPKIGLWKYWNAEGVLLREEFFGNDSLEN